ncbi:MAG TPA: NADH-quinone oxidoreductase subunit N [Acidimicrobiales bacterium]|jgi:NADH-quinone oxidoreductase subunit N
MIATLLAAATHATPVADKLPVPYIRYLTILPPIIMIGGGVVLLAIASLVRRPMRVRVSTVGSVVISAAALSLSIWQWFDVQEHGAHTYVAHAVVMDGFSVLINMLIASSMLLTALVADGYLKREGIEGAEFHVLALVSASGAMLMGSANDLIIVFLGLEILSIALYVLTAFNHRRAASGEAALKYFLLGGFSSAIFVYGIALTYGATGSTNLTQIADFLSKNLVLTNGLLLAGLALMLVGFAFKVAAVPFHMWTPDVYQGAPSPVTGFMAAIAKAGAFAALLRVLFSSLGVITTDWRPIVYGLAVLSLVVGSVVALRQRDVKRMLAYSSINHAGFILLGVESATTRGVSASLYYLFTYTFMTIGSFAIVTVLGREGDGDHDLTRYRGLSQRQPLLALCFAVLLLAQAGVPFTTGLWAKLSVVLATVSAGSVPLGVIAMVTAAIAAYFYLRVAVLMYSGPGRSDDQAGQPGPSAVPAPHARLDSGSQIGWASPEGVSNTITAINAELLMTEEPVAPFGEATPSVVKVPALTGLAIGICVAVTVGFGIVPSVLLDFAKHATLLFVGH